MWSTIIGSQHSAPGSPPPTSPAPPRHPLTWSAGRRRRFAYSPLQFRVIEPLIPDQFGKLHFIYFNPKIVYIIYETAIQTLK
jgi:hypothetical protein